MNSLTLKEIKYKSRNYYRGLAYLRKKYHYNAHLISCYEGISFRNLARYIKFDKTGKVFKLEKYLKKPRRFFLTNKSNKIKGVIVIASLPEFYKETGHEDYIVAKTETLEDYEKFLNCLSLKRKTEIVTFTSEQVKLVKNKFLVEKIHYWIVFSNRNNKKKSSISTTDFKLMDKCYLKIAQELSKKVPEESSPFRLLKFQLKDYSYKNYKISSENSLIFLGICPYATRIDQLSYFIKPLNADSFAINVLNIISKITKNQLIWRLKKHEAFQFKKIINKSSFQKITKEYHLHIKKSFSRD